MGRIKKSKKKDEEASVHSDLGGLDLTINEFGEVIGNKKIEDINKFLNKHVSDKKLNDREGDFGKDNPLQEYEAKDEEE